MSVSSVLAGGRCHSVAWLLWPNRVWPYQAIGSKRSPDSVPVLQNALKANPLREDLLLSASADESIRLWNVATGLTLAVFSGERGHATEILSLAWSLPNPNLFASGGMDFAVKIWSLQEVRFRAVGLRGLGVQPHSATHCTTRRPPLHSQSRLLLLGALLDTSASPSRAAHTLTRHMLPARTPTHVLSDSRTSWYLASPPHCWRHWEYTPCIR